MGVSHHSTDRIREIIKLLDVFRLERMVHMGITCASAIILMACAIYMIIQKQYTLAVGMFCSTGAITYSTGRLLRMWNDVLRIVYGKESEPD